MSRPSVAPRRRALRFAILVVTAIAISAGILLASSHVAGGARGQTFVSAPKGKPQAAAASTPTIPVRHVLFIGASYTAGLGATPPTEGYAYLVGRAPGWQAQVNGVSGTGFLNPGPAGNATFADRIGHLTVYPNPNVVVFQGGRNDVSYPAANLRSAVVATVDLTRKRFAGVQIVLLGPIPAHAPASPGQLEVAKTLRAAAVASGAVFVDPIAQNWITPENEAQYVGPVAAHPGNSGYAFIAQQVLSNLNELYDHHTIA